MKSNTDEKLKPPRHSLYFSDLIEQVYSQLPIALSTTLLLSLILVAVLWNEIEHMTLIIWIVVLWFLTIIRAIHYFKYQSGNQTSVENWAKLFYTGVILSGFIWGASGIILFPDKSLNHQIFLTFILGGLLAGSTTSLSVVQTIFRIFVILLITPVGLHFAVIGGKLYLAISGMITIYGIMCIGMATNNYKMFITSLRLKYENRQEIEQRRKAVDELTRQKVFLEAVLTNIEDGIVICDEQGILSFFNRATENFFQVTLQNLPPQEWASYYHLFLADGITLMQKEDIPLFRAFKGENIIDVEMVIAPEDGQKKTVLTSGRPLMDASGNKYGALVSMHDITERKIAEDFQKKAHEQLEIKVQERTNELQKALDEVKTLRGIIPICAYCRKIRNDDGYYERFEEYIHKHSGVDFSHTICPSCRAKYYSDL
jgi:PAS domain S-box-containing protein